MHLQGKSRRECGTRGAAPHASRCVGRGVPSPEIFLHFHGIMAYFGGILAVNFKFYSMNKTVKIHQNPADTSEYDAIKRGKQ